jgi:hypothetical protein
MSTRTIPGHWRTGRSPARRAVTALLATIALVTATPVAAAPPLAGDADPAVIANWNRVAAATIPGNPAAFLNYSFVHLAMYNAVNGITREYQLYQWDDFGPQKASPEAAAAVAAHRILSTYFPGAATALNTELDASLAGITDGVRKDQGIKYGIRAADHIIALRAADGRGAVVIVPTADAAGEWRPTPPAGAPFAVPWLGGVTPLTLNSLTQLDPGAPPALGTQEYRDELDEVRRLGASDSTERQPDETATARYIAEIPFGPMEAALRGYVSANPMDISDSARLFAATNTSIADAIGSVWNAKLKYMWWRPITAIREDHDDGDSLTVAVPGWTPLINTPPYPDWPSGLCGVVSALTQSLVRVTGEVDLTITTATQGTRTFSSKAEFDGIAVEARIWSGIHFRTADEVSIGIGTQAANWALDHYFAPAP